MPLDINVFDISAVDQMTGRQFEKYLKKLFTDLGYIVDLTGTTYYQHRGDFGGDLVIQKDGIKTTIQAKCSNDFIGINAIREVIGARDHYECQKAVVVTNNYFTKDAKIQAKDSDVVLIDRDNLIELINKNNLTQQD